jgi:hypothetical protein
MARTGRELRFSELEQPQRPGWLAILADRGKLAAKTRAETVGTEGSAAAMPWPSPGGAVAKGVDS